MDHTGPLIDLQIRRFTVYSLRVFPLWDGEPEVFPLGDDLSEITGRIVREQAVAGLIGPDIRPMRFCRIEQEEAVYLPSTQKTYYERHSSPVWKIMVPASGIYSRETILSCIARNAGRNAEKYDHALFSHPRAEQFYTYSGSEIRPVDESVFVIVHPPR